jgi:outer membrane protein TolC
MKPRNVLMKQFSLWENHWMCASGIASARRPIAAFVFFLALCAGSTAAAQTLSLYTVVDLSLRNSPEIRMAEADVRRAQAGLSESRDAYKPGFTFGSNIGYSYGFPVGQPTVLNVQSNSLAFSFSQPDYIRSARASLASAQLALKDAQEKVALEAALAYTELSTDQQELQTIKEQQALGDHLIEIETDRVSAGLDSRVEETRARLTNAQLAVRQIQLQGHVEIFSQKLANLTGLPLDRIVAEPQSIPAISPPQPVTPAPAALDTASNGVQAAYAAAKSKLYVAFGDSRTIDRPVLALGLNYSRFAEFNNYQNYYKEFQHNNFGVGINITIPLFDEARRAHARGSAADAAHATAEADHLRSQESEQRLELSRNIQTLAAEQRVAELQQQLAQDQLDAVTLELQNGTGHPGAPPITPKDEAQARIDERRYTIDLLESKFQLLQAELSQLRANDQLVTWATQIPR